MDYRGLVILVIACPCALAISTPLAMVTAITAGTKNGIIIKGGEYIEELNKVKTILFDKTGTLTEGKLEISEIKSFNNYSNKDIMDIACSLESKSNHPIAKAFNDYKKENRLKIKNVSNFESIPGKGLKAKIENKMYYVGKKDLFNYTKKLLNVDSLKDNLNKTSVIVGNDKEIMGLIGLKDKIWKNSSATIKGLKNEDISTFMITGDNKSTALEVSNNLGLKGFYHDLLPEDKVNKVEEISNKSSVAMVGDGVNDSPSLARTNVGIAMGMNGVDVAIETADIVLTKDEISNVSKFIKISKKAMNIIKQILVFAIIVKAFLVILGITGHIGLLKAILTGDMGVTLVVLANTLRIGKTKHQNKGLLIC